MSKFLKTKTVIVGENELTINELSGLERFHFLNFCSLLHKPDPLVEPSEDASEEEKKHYLEKLNKNFNLWRESTFVGQARLAAHGCKELGDDVETRHEFILNNMTLEQVKLLHDEIAILSNMPLPDEQNESSDEDQNQKAEPVDPKPLSKSRKNLRKT